MKRVVRLCLISALVLSFAAPGWAQAPRSRRATTGAPRAERADGKRRGASAEGPRRGSCRRTPSPATRSSCPAAPCASPRRPGLSSLTDPQGAPQAEYGFVSYTLDGAEPGDSPRHLRGQWRPGRVLGLSPSPGARARGGCRSTGRASAPRRRRRSSPMRRPGSISRISSSSTRPAPATAASVGGDQVRERFYSVEGDIDGLAAFVTRWLKEKNRLVRRNSSSARAMAAFAGRWWPRSCRAIRASA